MYIPITRLAISLLTANPVAARSLDTPFPATQSRYGVQPLEQDIPSFRPVNGTPTNRNADIQQPPTSPHVGASIGDKQPSLSSTGITQSRAEEGMAFRENHVGFLGATSFSAVFTENPSSLCIEDQKDVSTCCDSGNARGSLSLLLDTSEPPTISVAIERACSFPLYQPYPCTLIDDC